MIRLLLYLPPPLSAPPPLLALTDGRPVLGQHSPQDLPQAAPLPDVAGKAEGRSGPEIDSAQGFGAGGGGAEEKNQLPERRCVLSWALRLAEEWVHSPAEELALWQESPPTTHCSLTTTH